MGLLFVIIFIEKIGDINLFKNASFILVLPLNGHEYKKTSFLIGGKFRHFDIAKDAPFVDTISIMKNIDLLITIDTAIVHLAGVMGIKTWLLLGYGSDWRWSTKDTTYWYNSVEIIRMNEQKPLADLLPRVKKLLITEYENKR